ncbi:4-diphosphocytidyl-2C-methyl-D-erythritol kinase [Dentipellis sp. KUC8613]|nr:4-diphosphocytidyl-2C-methyl-D-erythritol kinase [Dentipellis sp. KUC8613]
MQHTTPASSHSLTARAPAKLNLFLHVTGRRADGYHFLQTAFEILTYHDDLVFSLRHDDRITLSCLRSCDASLIDDAAMAALDSPDNLVLKAARLLRSHYTLSQGADIVLHKRIPIGGGLGGGSADAAATLIALNRLWGVSAPTRDLHPLAKALGADVPVQLEARPSWGVGIGSDLSPLDLPSHWFLIIFPSTVVTTGAVFQDPRLKRDTVPITVEQYLAGMETRNDLEPVVAALANNRLRRWHRGHQGEHISVDGQTVLRFAADIFTQGLILLARSIIQPAPIPFHTPLPPYARSYRPPRGPSPGTSTRSRRSSNGRSRRSCAQDIRFAETRLSDLINLPK